MMYENGDRKIRQLYYIDGLGKIEGRGMDIGRMWGIAVKADIHLRIRK